jgi:hypothetical protein
MLFLASSISQQHGQQRIDAPAGSRQQRPKICNLEDPALFFYFSSYSFLTILCVSKKQQKNSNGYLVFT